MVANIKILAEGNINMKDKRKKKRDQEEEGWQILTMCLDKIRISGHMTEFTI